MLDVSITGQPVNVLRDDDLSVLDRISAVAAGGDHALALDADGIVWSWGRNPHGELGDDMPQSRATAPAIDVVHERFPRARAIAAGKHHSLALGDDGTVWAWGDNRNGRLGYPPADLSSSYSAIPTLVNGLAAVQQIAAGARHNRVAAPPGVGNRTQASRKY